MEIKPMYDNTIKMSMTNVKLEETKVQKRTADQIIPNGIYKVIKWEKIRQIFTLSFASLMLLTSIILFIIYSTVMDVSWFAYIIPITISVMSSWKMTTTYFERKRLIGDVKRYKQDLQIDLDSTPPFIAQLYMQLHVKQVAHNWMSIFLMFYGGIATLLLWWLKDVSWWIFDFKSWIGSMFSNPTTMAILFTILLITVAVVHIVFAIQRNKRIMDIRSYFGEAIASTADVESIKQSKNKMYRRLFVISIMVVLIIPIVVKFVMKFLARKK